MCLPALIRINNLRNDLILGIVGTSSQPWTSCPESVTSSPTYRQTDALACPPCWYSRTGLMLLLRYWTFRISRPAQAPVAFPHAQRLSGLAGSCPKARSGRRRTHAASPFLCLAACSSDREDGHRGRMRDLHGPCMEARTYRLRSSSLVPSPSLRRDHLAATLRRGQDASPTLGRAGRIKALYAAAPKLRYLRKSPLPSSSAFLPACKSRHYYLDKSCAIGGG